MFHRILRTVTRWKPCSTIPQTPIIFVTTEFPGCVDAVKMAEVVAGGERELKQNPFAACYINVTTGLRHNKEATAKVACISRTKEFLLRIFLPPRAE